MAAQHSVQPIPGKERRGHGWGMPGANAPGVGGGRLKPPRPSAARLDRRSVNPFGVTILVTRGLLRTIRDFRAAQRLHSAA